VPVPPSSFPIVITRSSLRPTKMVTVVFSLSRSNIFSWTSLGPFPYEPPSCLVGDYSTFSSFFQFEPGASVGNRTSDLPCPPPLALSLSRDVPPDGLSPFLDFFLSTSNRFLDRRCDPNYLFPIVAVGGDHPLHELPPFPPLLQFVCFRSMSFALTCSSLRHVVYFLKKFFNFLSCFAVRLQNSKGHPYPLLK